MDSGLASCRLSSSVQSSGSLLHPLSLQSLSSHASLIPAHTQVCELDLIFNFQKAYAILDELIIAGELQESSKKAVLKTVAQSDAIEEGKSCVSLTASAGG